MSLFRRHFFFPEVISLCRNREKKIHRSRAAGGKETDMKLKEAFQNLKIYEWIMFFAMILIGGYYSVTDTTHPLWYLIVNYISSIAGISCIFLCAHASWPTWIFAIVNTALYIVVLLYNKVYGTMALELLYYMPTNILGIIAWRKHPDRSSEERCLTRVMSTKGRILMTEIVLLSTLCYHGILVLAGGATAWLDAMTVAIGIIATFYEIRRYADQYWLWIVTDVIAVVQWILLKDTIMITKKSIYLVMAVIGLVRWMRLQKERNAENG